MLIRDSFNSIKPPPYCAMPITLPIHHKHPSELGGGIYLKQVYELGRFVFMDFQSHCFFTDIHVTGPIFCYYLSHSLSKLGLQILAIHSILFIIGYMVVNIYLRCGMVSMQLCMCTCACQRVSVYENICVCENVCAYAHTCVGGVDVKCLQRKGLKHH